MSDEKPAICKMIQPEELKKELPVVLTNGARSDTTNLWNVLLASYRGDLLTVQKLITNCRELAYAQYNYAPPIHLAVQEGHLEIVQLLLQLGAFHPAYRTYFFSDSLLTIAEERNYQEIAAALLEYINTPSLHVFKGDNGEILYSRTPSEREFELAVDKADQEKIKEILGEHPEYATDNSFFWGEGILMMPAKDGNFKLMELLLGNGATFPMLSKWPQAYYFERDDSTKFILENGMSPNHHTWQHVTILHYMAKKGDIHKTKLLLEHGAGINAVDGEYRSTPLGIASRYGQTEMVEFLLNAGADPHLAGAAWATPIEWARRKGHIKITEILLSAGI